MKTETVVYAIVLVCALAIATTSVAQSTTAQDANASAVIVTIDTPILKALENDIARAVVEKHLPRLIKAMDEDLDVMDFLGSSSLKELSIDDNHVLNFDEEMLAKLQSELAEAQRI